MSRHRGPMARRRRWLRLRAWATTAGALDARGELGSFGVKLLHAARRDAAANGVLDVDVDEATFAGLDHGHQQS